MCADGNTVYTYSVPTIANANDYFWNYPAGVTVDTLRGDSIDVTKNIHPGFHKIAVELTRDMGLRIAGVDIMVRDGDITKDPKKSIYYIIEINAAPGLDHYVTTGIAQRKIVEDMYLKILKALGKKD